MEEKRIPVEICGDKQYLTEKELQWAKERTEEAIETAMKILKISREEAESIYPFRILKEE